MPLIQRPGISKQRHLIPDSLTHSSGIITAVVNGVTYTHTLSGLSANTLYFLYMRINSGSVILTSSTTVPSTYRSSFADAILVGAFLTGFAATYAQFVAIDTLKPNITVKVVKGTTTITNGAGNIITAWSTTTEPFFDATNGFFRCPLTGSWQFAGLIRVGPSTGTANLNQSNIYTYGGIKATAPANYTDASDNFGDDNGFFQNGVDQSRRHFGIAPVTAGSYVWLGYQSNIASGVSIVNSRFDATLVSIPTQLKDL